ncbi:MAG: MFS transporter [Thermoanaerobacteraceae bacterium]|nr:MFS transporter [Thermoanaerobacteraceae bacterium]
MSYFKYVIGNFGIFYINATISTFFLFIFNYIGIHNPAMLLGMGWILGAVLQPLIGIFSDKYIKLGRKFFIWIGISICIISLLFLFKKRGNIIYDILLFYIGVHIYQIPLSAFIPDQIDKERLQTISGLWNFSGSLGSIIAPLLGVILLNQGYNYIFLGLLIIMIVSTAIPLVYIKEKQNKAYTRSIRQSVTSYLTNKSVRNFYIAKFLWWTGLGAFLPFIVNNLVEKGLSPGSAGIIYTSFMALNCISSIIFSRFKIGNIIFPLSIAIIGFSICALLMYMSKMINFIIFLILVMGMLYGILLVSSYSVMIGMIPKGEGGMYLGLDNIFINIPQALSALLVSTAINNNNEIFLLISSLFMSLSCIYILHNWNT